MLIFLSLLNSFVLKKKSPGFYLGKYGTYIHTYIHTCHMGEAYIKGTYSNRSLRSHEHRDVFLGLNNFNFLKFSLDTVLIDGHVFKCMLNFLYLHCMIIPKTLQCK